MQIRHSFEARGDDFYASPPEALWGLLAAEGGWLPQFIWEPACGDGGLVRPLRAAGYQVEATDLVDRGCPEGRGGIDFLEAWLPPVVGCGVVTNPPYRLATEFVDHALGLSSYVAMLLRLQFLESERRHGLFQRWPLSAVHVFSARLPMMHRAGWDGPKASSPTAFAWFVFDDRRGRERRVSWISPEMIDAGRALVRSFE